MSDLDLLVTRMTTAGASRVYKVGAVPASPILPYIVLSLDTGTPLGTRVSGHSPSARRRLTVQMFGKSYDAVMAMAGFADEAFKDVTLSELTAAPFSVRELQTQVMRDPDGEVLLYVLHTYRL